MSVIETLQAAWLFAIPLLITAATWWAWASLLRRERRWYHWMALVVPALYAWWLWGPVLDDSSWQRVFQIGYATGPLAAGLLLTLTVRYLASLPSEQRKIALGAATASVLGLLLIMVMHWSGGDRNLDTVRMTVPSIYAGALGLSIALGGTLAMRAGTKRWWRPAAAGSGLVAAFMAATFFFPVEFINSCFTRTLLPYTLC